MKPNPVHRLPAPLEAAVQRLKLAAREAAERTIESLGLAALASSSAYQRDGLLGAQFELNRKSAVFALTFNDAFDERMHRELGPRLAGSNTETVSALSPLAPSSALSGLNARSTLGGSSDWQGLRLVEDREVEQQISAERFGLEISHACEWELRELEGYVVSLLGEAGTDSTAARERNPLGPHLVGHAMLRGIEAVSDRADTRKLLSSELARSLSALLPTTYQHIVADMRNAGVQPLGLTARTRTSRGVAPGPAVPGIGGGTGVGTGGGGGPGGGDGADTVFAGPGGPSGSGSGSGSRSGATSFGGPTRSGIGAPRGGATFGSIDPALMTLIRRLAQTSVAGGAYRSGGDTTPSGIGTIGGGGPGSRSAGFDSGWSAADGGGPLPANLIRVHRDELRQASHGALDHMVIDVIGFMFDQILADPKVPPQMARQIARLQLPVLRTALGDATFFSSRRHPVRRFINRIASLGAAFEDFDEDTARSFLARVKALVQEVVEGDFEQIGTYEQKLVQLEHFVAETAANEAQGDAAALLSEKEDQQRLRELYADRLAGELKDLEAPAFLRDFITRVWSQVLLRAGDQGGSDGPLATKLRRTGRELFLSVQPKATPAHRKQFLAELPKLMQELTEGMNLIRWPEAERRAFFGQLMPSHAEALKRPAGRQLDINLMARRVEGALQRPMPSREELRTLPAVPVLTDEVAVPQLFSAEEAQRVGLVTEAAVDWNGKVDIDLTAEAQGDTPTETATPLPGLPAPAEALEPAAGRALADHVQIGFAYQMYLDGAWQKVRLSHVSTARSFFIFTHGAKQRKTVSLTLRMLQRLCETGRMKAYESAYLIDRAAARARRQLASLGGGGGGAAAAQPA